MCACVLAMEQSGGGSPSHHPDRSSRFFCQFPQLSQCGGRVVPALARSSVAGVGFSVAEPHPSLACPDERDVQHTNTHPLPDTCSLSSRHPHRDHRSRALSHSAAAHRPIHSVSINLDIRLLVRRQGSARPGSLVSETSICGSFDLGLMTFNDELMGPLDIFSVKTANWWAFISTAVR